MATTKLTKTGLNKQDKGDLNWEQDLDDGFDDFESRIGKSYAGDPNGNVSAEWLLQTCYDTSNGVIYVATTTGAAGTAVWEAVLEVSQLAANGGSIPELDRTNAFTEQQLVPGGDQASPSWSFDGDQDTGMYSPSPDVIRFAVGGSAHWDFQDDGSLVFTGGSKVGADNINANLLYESNTRVVESGSNSDGYWVRYSDGTQIATASRTVSYSGGGNEVNFADNWPINFNSISREQVQAGITVVGSAAFTKFTLRVSSVGSSTLTYSFSADNNTDYTFCATGIGTWT